MKLEEELKKVEDIIKEKQLTKQQIEEFKKIELFDEYEVFLQNPDLTEEFKFWAVKQFKYLMQYFQDGSCIKHLLQYGQAIKYFQNPSEELQLEAVNQNGYFIEYIPNPSEAVQLAAVNKNKWAIYSIQNISEKIIELHNQKGGNYEDDKRKHFGR